MTSAHRQQILDAARAAVRAQVCTLCLEGRDDGSCALTGRQCAVERHLEPLVDAVLSVSSGHLAEYDAAVRARVCSGCEGRTPGTCPLRDSGECALRSYLPLVVDAIDRVRILD